MFGWIKEKSKGIVDQYKSGINEFVDSLNSDIKTVQENIQHTNDQDNQQQQQQEEQKENNHSQQILKKSNNKKDLSPLKNKPKEQELPDTRDYEILSSFLMDYISDIENNEIENCLKIILKEFTSEDLKEDPSFELNRSDFKTFTEFLKSEEWNFEEIVIGIDTFDDNFLKRYNYTEINEEEQRMIKLRFFYSIIYKTGVQYKINQLKKSESTGQQEEQNQQQQQQQQQQQGENQIQQELDEKLQINQPQQKEDLINNNQEKELNQQQEKDIEEDIKDTIGDDWEIDEDSLNI